MAYNHQYVKSFLVGLLFGKNVHPDDTDLLLLSVVNEGDVLLAVKKAYIDMSPRTFTKSEEENKFDEKLKNNLLYSLACDIRDYMENGTGGQSFDDWHHDVCTKFLSGNDLADGNSSCDYRGLAGLLSNAGRDPDEATYGKAQKIVNMTFKYLYCYPDAPKYYERFKPCHMPLDSYILDWFFEVYEETWNNEQKPAESKRKLSKSGKYHLPKWSNLKYESPEAISDGGIPQYKEIQDAIKEIIARHPSGVTRLEAEFVIWYEAKTDLPFTY